MDHTLNDIGLSSQESFLSEGMYNEVMNGVGSFNLDHLLKEEPQDQLGACGLLAAPIQNLQDSYLCNDPYFVETPQLISDVLLSPDSTQPQNVVSTVPLPTCKLPCQEEYPGPYNFELAFNSETSGKNKWLYSHKLKKLYVNMKSRMPIQFKWTSEEVGLRVRALPIYCSQESFEYPVLRCPNHSSSEEPSNEGFEHVNHVIRCDHSKVEYHTDSESQRLSVVVPMDMPQPGTDWVTVVYTFMCKNSCPVGMNRRAIAVIFTLEQPDGQVLGRRTMSVRICSCPKRDMAKEETDPEKVLNVKRLMSNKPHQPHGAKRLKVDHHDNMVSMLVEKKYAESVAKYAYSLYVTEASLDDRDLTPEESAAMESFREIIENSWMQAKPKLNVPGKFH